VAQREALGSILGRESGYTNRGFSWFSSVPTSRYTDWSRSRPFPSRILDVRHSWDNLAIGALRVLITDGFVK
jgi:hypothetical protein